MYAVQSEDVTNVCSPVTFLSIDYITWRNNSEDHNLNSIYSRALTGMKDKLIKKPTRVSKMRRSLNVTGKQQQNLQRISFREILVHDLIFFWSFYLIPKNVKLM